MRWIPAIVLSLGIVQTAAAGEPVTAPATESIVEVLQRSHAQRLAMLVDAPADSPRAQALRETFERLRRQLDLREDVSLRVVLGETVAETLQGRVVIANEQLGALPEAQREFVLAHELGHIALGHWAEVGRLYLKWVPGAVVRERTDAVALPLGREASALAHRHEFDADAFALQGLRSLGRADAESLAAFVALGPRSETVTHPATRRRIAALREAIQRGSTVAQSSEAAAAGR